MKNIILLITLFFTFISCQKMEEIAIETKTKVKAKTQETITETVNEQLNKIVNSEKLSFSAIFPHDNSLIVENESGRKVAFPNGTPFYVFKYKVSDKDLLLKTLIEQPTLDESQSKKEFEKIDGSTIIEKITFFQKFLPENTIDLSFLEDIKNDKNIEYYKVKRFPNASTVIYNPKNQMVYQFVEVKK